MTESIDTPMSVPELVGMPAADAHDVALDARLLAVPQNARHTGAGRSRVTAQRPKPGGELPEGSTVSIWVDDPQAGPTDGPEDPPSDGGGGGTKVPQGPSPQPTSGHGS